VQFQDDWQRKSSNENIGDAVDDTGRQGNYSFIQALVAFTKLPVRRYWSKYKLEGTFVGMLSKTYRHWKMERKVKTTNIAKLNQIVPWRAHLKLRIPVSLTKRK